VEERPAATRRAFGGGWAIVRATGGAGAPARDALRLLGGNTAAVAVSRLVSAAVTLAATPFLYASLGSREYGLWVLLLGGFAVAGLGDLGLGSAQLREVARAHAAGRPEKAGPALALGLTLLPALGLALGGALFLSWPGLSGLVALGDLAEETRRAALLLAAAFVVDGVGVAWRAVLEGTDKIATAAAVTAAGSVLASVLGVAFVAAGQGMAGLAAAWLLAAVARTAALALLARTLRPVFRPSLRGLRDGEARRLLLYGLRVQASSGAAVVNNETDRLLVGGVFSVPAAAAFDIGARLANALRFLPWCALYTLFPAVAAIDAGGDRARLDAVYLRATRVLAVFACLGGAVLVAGADPLVRLLIGEPLPLAATSLALLAGGYAVNLISGAAAAVTRAEGHPGRETRAMVLTAALNVVVSAPLLVALGPEGVPAGTALATVVGTGYFLWRFHRDSGRPLRPLAAAVWRPLVAGVAATAAVVAVAGHLPDGDGRLDAAAAVAARGALCLALGAGLLVALHALDVRRPVRALRRLALGSGAPSAPARGEGR
jgi:O-antigen/teichoic acid export membrane protein